MSYKVGRFCFKLKPGEVWLLKRIVVANILPQRLVARMFKVDQSNVSRICSGSRLRAPREV